MRLLHTRTLEMEEFISDDDIPSYGILTHTWGEQEVSYKDWESLTAEQLENKKGFPQIRNVCDQAAKDGFDWAWIDTCCIDKRSSAELSEAINSMFRWYRNAARCYAYLSDVLPCGPAGHPTIYEDVLRQSRWFTRGWTLQELVAPSIVMFYAQDWTYIGAKTDMATLLADITHISEPYLLGKDMSDASISQRMSWASNRKTSRKEDVAYCLLGIFGIHMPLLYGEGDEAFQRLQMLIMQSWPHDHTLFDWGRHVAIDDLPWASPRDVALCETPLPTSSLLSEHESLGLLARAPSDFSERGELVPTASAAMSRQDDSLSTRVPICIAKGQIRLDLHTTNSRYVYLLPWSVPRIVQPRAVRYVTLLCGSTGDMFASVFLPIIMHSNVFVNRTRDIMRGPDVFKSVYDTSTLIFRPLRPISSQTGDFILRRTITNTDMNWTPILPSDNGLIYEILYHTIRFKGSARHIFSVRWDISAHMAFHIVIFRVYPDQERRDSRAGGLQSGMSNLSDLSKSSLAVGLATIRDTSSTEHKIGDMPFNLESDVFTPAGYPRTGTLKFQSACKV